MSKGSTVIIDSLPKRSWSITSYNPIYFKTEVKTVKIPNPRNSGFVRTSPLFRPSLVLLFFVLLLCHYPKSFSSQETSYLWIYIFAHVFNVCAFTSFSPLLSRPPYYSLCLHICRQTLILILIQIIISICANCPPWCPHLLPLFQPKPTCLYTDLQINVLHTF